VTAFRTRRLAAFLVQKAQLQRVVAVALLVAHLEHRTGPDLQDRDRVDLALLVVHLRHADLQT